MHITTTAGFEPTRGDPIGFQVQHLNHSVMLPLVQEAWTPEARDRTLAEPARDRNPTSEGSNPGPPARNRNPTSEGSNPPPTTTSPSLWDRTLIFLHSRRHSLGLLRYPCAMPSGTRGENPVAIAHLHTTLNKSRDELYCDIVNFLNYEFSC